MSRLVQSIVQSGRKLLIIVIQAACLSVGFLFQAVNSWPPNASLLSVQYTKIIVYVGQ